MGQAGPYLGLGIQLMASMVGFVVLGYFADRWLGTAPWLLIVGAFLGMVGAGVTLWRVTQELGRKEGRPRVPRPPAPHPPRRRQP